MIESKTGQNFALKESLLVNFQLKAIKIFIKNKKLRDQKKQRRELNIAEVWYFPAKNMVKEDKNGKNQPLYNI